VPEGFSQWGASNVIAELCPRVGVGLLDGGSGEADERSIRQGIVEPRHDFTAFRRPGERNEIGSIRMLQNNLWAPFHPCRERLPTASKCSF